MSETGIEQSRQKTPTARFFQRDLTQPRAEQDELFAWATCAVCCEVLEHVDDPISVLRNAAYYLAPGAKLIITVPGGPMSAFDRHIGHRQHFSPPSIDAVIRAAGLIPLYSSGVGFPFFNLYRLTVILRGSALIRDVGSGNRELSGLAKGMMKLFSWVLQRRWNSQKWGWQIIACAEKPKSG